jgi:hypothetical protein
MRYGSKLSFSGSTVQWLDPSGRVYFFLWERHLAATIEAEGLSHISLSRVRRRTPRQHLIFMLFKP